jgi:dimethylargininase
MPVPVRNEGDRLTKVVVCTPGDEYAGVTDTEAHHIAAAADRDNAVRQHGALTAVLESFGCVVIDIPELAGHPNSVFTRDTALCAPSGFVRLRMGLPTRRGEEEWMAARLSSLGERCIGTIEEPGTVEGGDVILAGSVAFVGRSDRTNQAGVDQINDILSREGFEVRSAGVPEPFLHIGGAMSIVSPRLVLACSGIFPPGFFRGFDSVEIECEDFSGGNVICLGDGEVLADAANMRMVSLLEAGGLTVHRIDLGEFVKGIGGPSCLVLPVERVPSG